METRRQAFGMVFVVLCLAGCADIRPPDERGNFTIVLQCGSATPFPVKVEGNVYAEPRALAASNCSLHGANGVVTVRCPMVELTVPAPVRETEGYLQHSSDRSVS